MRVSDQNHPKGKKCKKAKWLSEEALQIAEERREMKDKGEKEIYTQLNAELQRIASRDKKAFLSLPVALWNSKLSWVDFSLSPLPFAFLLSSAICKASSDNHCAFLHFFFFGTVLFAASVQYYGPLSIVLQALCLLDLIL